MYDCKQRRDPGLACSRMVVGPSGLNLRNTQPKLRRSDTNTSQHAAPPELEKRFQFASCYRHVGPTGPFPPNVRAEAGRAESEQYGMEAEFRPCLQHARHAIPAN